MEAERPEIEQVKAWLDGERAYAENKWDPAVVDAISPEEYEGWVLQYLHRSIVLGVENPNGMQALGKALRTLTAMTESMLRRGYVLPAPGVPSGEVG